MKKTNDEMRAEYKHDVDKFLSESNRPSIQHRLLIATTDFIGANARQVCDAQEKPVIRFLRIDFVSGNMPANKRKIKLDQLKALSANTLTFPITCRHNPPLLDMIARTTLFPLSLIW